ncbi:MAG TPA: hypothetical protein VJ997_09120 [Longimicrobiales bacterium]|nr:hypothetical protein [Longimicrobiales bacterium]
MRVRSTLRGLTAAALLALTPAVARSQTIPSPFRFVETRQEAGIFAGQASMAKGRFGFGPAGGTELGARWSIDLSGPLGFEVVAARISGTRDVINPAQVVGDPRIGEADANIGTLDARLRLTLTGDRTWHRLAPFVLAGGGMAFDMSGASALDEELLADDRFDFGTSFFGTVGAGARVFLTDRVALRGDAVFSLWKIDTPPGFSSPDRGFTSVEQSEWVSGRHLTLSAVIRF